MGSYQQYTIAGIYGNDMDVHYVQCNTQGSGNNIAMRVFVMDVYWYYWWGD
ncbi:MAG TPA: hypothetical protein VLA46_03575 [Saprospiraceae bacterium]|nr:hypothetical protein [Saprospiraceae bacterium]